MRFTYPGMRPWATPAQRSVVMAPRGMAASSQPLATRAGVRVLENGGNAVDAALAMVAVLSVVEPYSVGIGGDCFALCALDGGSRIVGLNGSGRASSSADREALVAAGHKKIPIRHGAAVTVPGAVAAWADLAQAHGTMGLDTLLAPAIDYAAHGFPVSEVIAGEWAAFREHLAADPSSARSYLLDGRPPRPGQMFVNPGLARSLKLIAERGPGALYEGELAEAIANTVQAAGGWLSQDDLAAHRSEWVDPIMLDYRGWTVLELPPNGQGLTALEILSILEGYELAALEPLGADKAHLVAEAIKIAFEDRNRYITDPAFSRAPVEKLLSPQYAARCRERIDPESTLPPGEAAPPLGSDTVYLCAGDEQGNAVSLISSIYTQFGSGLVPTDTGILLHCRGISFSLDQAKANCLEPGKRPMHTIIPGMLLDQGRLAAAFGVMGGDMQPQGHAQVLINIIDHGLNLQQALDAPRLRCIEGKKVYLEEGFAEGVPAEMERRGHRIDWTGHPINQVGGGQIVWRDQEQGIWLGASDRRKDGCAMGY
ncbi:MAG: gamma-glutamyltransferase [Desulfarculaceae bacterium]|nr:gamma-glutamyltransferase [Desulfarculaceae bacterium]MCF8073561.1 gamma-glutamyltransferase [Desulfarculaceae bacterium]MCF8103083.1 gamma-glutamyltransferase [Desulfarculaceae bacterium]MCF8115723.1 gamma-glutamyltransferase [Desulfarculaceae bacterium]